MSEFFKIAEVSACARRARHAKPKLLAEPGMCPVCLLQQVGIDKNDIPELTQVSVWCVQCSEVWHLNNTIKEGRTYIHICGLVVNSTEMYNTRSFVSHYVL